MNGVVQQNSSVHCNILFLFLSMLYNAVSFVWPAGIIIADRDRSKSQRRYITYVEVIVVRVVLYGRPIRSAPQGGSRDLHKCVQL